jgi:hypothetical protein
MTATRCDTAKRNAFLNSAQRNYLKPPILVFTAEKKVFFAA